MNRRYALVLSLFSAIANFAIAARAESAPENSAQQLVVLRSGEVLAGRVSHVADRYLVESEGTEVRLPAHDVDFVCSSLDEAYRIQAARRGEGKIDDHLHLAEWCLREGLNGYAAQEITTAMGLDSANPRVAQLDTRLQRAMRLAAVTRPDDHAEKVETVSEGSPTATLSSEKVAARSAIPVSTSEIDRRVRTLPTGTIETFTRSIQPMLLNYCATAGCHGASGTPSYALIRPAQGLPQPLRLTQRNLYNTLQWIDRESPADSKLLSAAQQAHAKTEAAGAGPLSSAQYQELVVWVWQSAMAAKATMAPMIASNNTISDSRSVLTNATNAPVAVPRFGAGIVNGWATKDISLQSIAGPEITGPEFSQNTSASSAPMWAAPVVKVSGNRTQVNTANGAATDHGLSKMPTAVRADAESPTVNRSTPPVSTIAPGSGTSPPQPAPDKPSSAVSN